MPSTDHIVHFRYGSRGRAKSVGPSDHKKIPAEANEIGCCRKCNSRVFEAEKLIARCGWFHKDCFKCFNCNRLLDVSSYQDGRKDGIFCNTCHKAILEEMTINIEYAKAAKIYWILDTDRAGVSDKWATAWEKMIEVEMEKYSDAHPLIKF